jgi:hypothetical protein
MSRARIFSVVVAVASALVSTSTRALDARAADAPAPSDVSVFYAPLAQHGRWSIVEPYGWVWSPDVELGWRPYSVGYWAWVDPHGWTWVSDEPFAWAVYHYGRWAFDENRGWLWVPGTVWAPAWAEMRMDDTWIGWAPIPPDVPWRRDAGPVAGSANVEFYAWTFVPIRAFGETDLSARAVEVVHVGRLLAGTKRVVRPTLVDGTVTLRALPVEEIDRVRGGPVRRYRAAETVEVRPGPAVQGEQVVLVRPPLVATAPTVEPPQRSALSPAQAKEWMDRRAAQMAAYLERQRRAVAENLPPPPSLPAPPPPPAVLERFRQDAANALERERQRIQRLFSRGP